MSEAGSQKSVLALPAAIVVAYAFARAWHHYQVDDVSSVADALLRGFVQIPRPEDYAGQVWPVLTGWLTAPIVAAAVGYGSDRPFLERYQAWARALGLAAAPLLVAAVLLVDAIGSIGLRNLAKTVWWAAWVLSVARLNAEASRSVEPRRLRRWSGVLAGTVGLAGADLAQLHATLMRWAAGRMS